jgi:plasmid stabilization system protein ParE
VSRYQVRFEARAEAEARAAFLWYRDRNPRAADRFQVAFEECIEAIAVAAEQFPQVAPGLRRRLLLHRFPYAVLYALVAEEVVITAVMHLHRRPGYWRGEP